MTEKSKSKRIKFPERKQKQFLYSAKNKINKTWREIAEMIGVSVRTLTDWKREKFTMTLEAAQILSKKSEIEIPKKCKTKDRYWYTSFAGKAGGNAKNRKVRKSSNK